MITIPKIDWQKVLLFLLVLFLVSKLFTQCQNNKTQLATINALNSENKEYKLKNGKLVLSTETITFSNSQLKNELKKTKTDLELSKKFHKVETLTKVVTETKIDTVNIVYKDSVQYNFERTGTIKNKEYSLSYKSNEKGLKLTNFVIPDTVTMISGTKRKWLFGKETATFDIVHSNKLVKTTELKHIEKKQPKRFYETTIFKLGIGFIAGAILVK